MYFKCHTTKAPFFTEGKLYPIIDEELGCFVIMGDDDEEHYLTKVPDFNGVSYKSFMTLEGADKVTISREEYQSLLDDSEKLSCLEACGVDNWQGYDDAMDMYHSEE